MSAAVCYNFIKFCINIGCAAYAALLMGRTYIGIVQSNDDAVTIKKRLALMQKIEENSDEENDATDEEQN